MANDKKTIALPSMLAYDRKLEVSDALMMSGDWEQWRQQEKDNASKAPDKKVPYQWQKIAVTKRQNRSTQSAYGTSDDNKVKPNPVSSDSDDANLPYDKDTLKVGFTLRVIGNLGEPFGCNDPVFEKLIKEKVDESKDEVLKELAFRYAQNIVSGRFLWRNRVSAEAITVVVKLSGTEEALEFNGYDFPLNDFSTTRENQKLGQVADEIFRGLHSKDEFSCLNVDAYIRLGNGQHVFPSQEMNMGEKKKVLFKLGECAALHSVKVGNAIRTIDDWYDNAESPIAVEPFGSVTQRGMAYRPSKNDLYTLMQNWVNDKELDLGQRCFVLANLIRGGVFGGK